MSIVPTEPAHLQASSPAPLPAKESATAAHLQIAALNRYITQTSQASYQQQVSNELLLPHAVSPSDGMANAPLNANSTALPPLRSALRFHDVWRLIHAEAQVERATEQAPNNAGPLNPHRLVLRTLERMRELSPEYLQQFLSQLETLQWLDQALPHDKASAAVKAASQPKAKPRKR